MLTATKLLDTKKPEDLFTGDPGKAKQQFKEFALKWHPDRNTDPKAPEVFAHIRQLYEKGIDKVNKGLWEGAGILVLHRNGWPHPLLPINYLSPNVL